MKGGNELLVLFANGEASVRLDKPRPATKSDQAIPRMKLNNSRGNLMNFRLAGAATQLC